MSWLKQLLTDDEGQHDVGFYLWAIGSVVYLVLACVNYARFDPLLFGSGFSAMLAAGGAMSWMRSGSKP